MSISSILNKATQAASSTGTTSGSSSTSASGLSATSAASTQNQFLTMLVAQMQNQDPMNPMDNSQLTSQLAAIQTVSGISDLNTSIQGLGTQFNQMSALQSVNLVGHSVTVPGNVLSQNASNTSNADGSYSLASAATAVQMQVYDTAGTLVKTTNLGPQSAGMHTFTWAAGSSSAASAGYTFKITAANGTTPVTATPYTQDKVVAVTNSGNTLQLQLQNLGTVNYSAVQNIN
ncbi:MAG: flagellar hook assembly protein FlgD [Burkholderiaceae bacterium]|nr:flagellar hook assembly protein FlgD [Burkholderiaceae bacterium]